LIEQQQAKVDQYGRDIENARRGVNQYSQSSVNQFNAKINSYNTQLENIQGSIDRFNRRVDEFNAELRRVGTPIR
jgi:septal ring factor EnvC (AmiA/AmiB activator)